MFYYFLPGCLFSNCSVLRNLNIAKLNLGAWKHFSKIPSKEKLIIYFIY